MITTGTPPTERQAEILAFMRAFLKWNQCPPTIREIMEWLGTTSPNGILTHLNLMQRKALVRRVKARGQRCWVPVDVNFCPTCGRPFDP